VNGEGQGLGRKKRVGYQPPPNRSPAYGPNRAPTFVIRPCCQLHRPCVHACPLNGMRFRGCQSLYVVTACYLKRCFRPRGLPARPASVPAGSLHQSCDYPRVASSPSPGRLLMKIMFYAVNAKRREDYFSRRMVVP
jgi:hypothetical protein